MLYGQNGSFDYMVSSQRDVRSNLKTTKTALQYFLLSPFNSINAIVLIINKLTKLINSGIGNYTCSGNINEKLHLHAVGKLPLVLRTRNIFSNTYVQCNFSLIIVKLYDFRYNYLLISYPGSRRFCCNIRDLSYISNKKMSNNDKIIRRRFRKSYVTICIYIFVHKILL